MRHQIFALATCVALTACGGGLSTDLEGFYSIDGWNENLTSCADPGPSVLGSRAEVVFYIKVDNFFVDFLNVNACTDLATCEFEAGDDSTVYIGDLGGFTEGSDADGWVDEVAFAFDDGNGACTGILTRKTMTVDGATAVTIRTETFDVPTFPARTTPGECEDNFDEEDVCCDEDAVAAVGGAACSSVEVVHGTKTADL